jgi:multiple antibiotic resistance protein
MHYVPFPLQGLIGSFLLAFPALFSIVNPVGGALIFDQVLVNRSAADKHKLAGEVGLYTAIVTLVSLWAGSYVLNFFGISLGALRIGGGLVVASRAWLMLNESDEHVARKEQQARPAAMATDVAFYPLTMPLTAGPGTISVAVALGAERPELGHGLILFMGGMSGACVLVALSVWICYRFADAVLRLLGNDGAKVLGRLVAFLLLCIGTQIVVNGVLGVAGEFMAGQR